MPKGKKKPQKSSSFSEDMINYFEIENDISKQQLPCHLKGKQIGLWYKEKRKMKNANIADDFKKDKKKDLNNDTSFERAFPIRIKPEIQKCVMDLLSSVKKKPPPSIVSEFKNRKKSSTSLSESEVVQIEKENELSGDEEFDNFLKSIEADKNKNTSDSAILEEDLLSNGKETSKASTENEEALRYWIYGDSAQNDGPDEEEDILEEYEPEISSISLSVDKYKYLEESAFKDKFLNIITGTIESNLDKALWCNFKLNRNHELDNRLKSRLSSKRRSSHNYRRMIPERERLPAFKMKEEILKAIEDNQVILIKGETGCGKTTQVAQFILDEAILSGNGSLCSIVCTQPRKISAISVAQRVAVERDEMVGNESVGFQVRLEKKLPRPQGSILFCTTGMLIQYMQGDPALGKFSHIVLDEIHERDTICDFALTILRNVITKRQDLKVILMSATLNAEQFSEYFDNCPIIDIPGYTYFVQEHYLEDIFQQIKFEPDAKLLNSRRKKDEVDKNFKTFVVPYVKSLERSKAYRQSVINLLNIPDLEGANTLVIVATLRHICVESNEGAILVFVPGWSEIKTLSKVITESSDFPESRYMIIPLHSMLPTVNQQTVFNKPPPGVRKIILATNIAETSITIDDVVYVIDSGKIKMRNFDTINNVSTLNAEWVSLANARQRRGRAGRVQAGVCYHLYTKGRERSLLDYPLPEMMRTRLEEVVLNVKILQLGHAYTFLQKVMNPPDERAITLAIDLLTSLNALDENENLTPLGFHLAKLPLDPQIGKMLLMSVMFSCLDPILTIAATLSYKDPFYTPLGCEKLVDEKKKIIDDGRGSDHLIMVEAMRRWEIEENRGRGRNFCSSNFLTRNTLFLLRDMKQQFTKYLMEMEFIDNGDYKMRRLNMNSENMSLIKAVVCSGLYPNVAVVKKKVKASGKEMSMLYTPEDGSVAVHPRSVNYSLTRINDPFLIYHLKLRSSKIYLHDTSSIQGLPILFFGHGLNISNKNRKIMMRLNNGLIFSCSQSTYEVIEEVKIRLDWMVEYNLSHPKEIVWRENSKDAIILRALVDLITYEGDDSSDES